MFPSFRIYHVWIPHFFVQLYCNSNSNGDGQKEKKGKEKSEVEALSLFRIEMIEPNDMFLAYIKDNGKQDLISPRFLLSSINERLAVKVVLFTP